MVSELSRRSFRIALAIVVASVVAAIAAGGVAVKLALDYPDRPHAGQGRTIEVQIDRGMSFPAVAERLARAGVIDRPRWFRLYAMHRGATTRVRHGRYPLRDDMTPREVLDALLAGVEDVTVPVTIPEGLHILEVFAILDRAGVARAADLEAVCRDPEFLADRGIAGDTCEGYLFPDTYRFRAPTPARAVLDRLIERHRAVWQQARRKHAASVERLERKLGWTDRELLILASIVEKEAAVDSERERIAQVFINRLTSPSFRPKRLETDPTIRYGCTVPLEKSAACRAWDPTQRLRRRQLDDVDNPYNTYRHEGLPPGPIANPGRRSIEAAMNPDGSRFFYFVARNDGTHVFSKTLAEHTRWVNRYQK
ncbi:MAG: endolytic transglycosylase MltG [Deltaproteobacteria bacterium]|nr:MAG: endolytic transglycosylase MltG [Deltaproteobacteria bacterium]